MRHYQTQGWHWENQAGCVLFCCARNRRPSQLDRHMSARHKNPSEWYYIWPWLCSQDMCDHTCTSPSCQMLTISLLEGAIAEVRPVHHDDSLCLPTQSLRAVAFSTEKPITLLTAPSLMSPAWLTAWVVEFSTDRCRQSAITMEYRVQERAPLYPTTQRTWK